MCLGHDCPHRARRSLLLGPRFVTLRGDDLGGGPALDTRRDEHRVDLVPGMVGTQVPDVGDVLDLQDVDAVVQDRAADQSASRKVRRLPTCAKR